MKAKRNGTAIVEQIVEDSGNLATLVDQVVEGHAPIVVARGGEPKAALVSLEDYARLKQATAEPEQKLSWEEWSARNQAFHKAMLARRGGKPLDKEIVDQALQAARQELEERDSQHGGLGR